MGTVKYKRNLSKVSQHFVGDCWGGLHCPSSGCPTICSRYLCHAAYNNMRHNNFLPAAAIADIVALWRYLKLILIKIYRIEKRCQALTIWNILGSTSTWLRGVAETLRSYTGGPNHSRQVTLKTSHREARKRFMYLNGCVFAWYARKHSVICPGKPFPLNIQEGRSKHILKRLDRLNKYIFLATFLAHVTVQESSWPPTSGT